MLEDGQAHPLIRLEMIPEDRRAEHDGGLNHDEQGQDEPRQSDRQSARPKTTR